MTHRCCLEPQNEEKTFFVGIEQLHTLHYAAYTPACVRLSKLPSLPAYIIEVKFWNKTVFCGTKALSAIRGTWLL